jgi:preprotein translocase subunit SecG
MYALVSALIMIVCVLLIGVVLVQNSKGGGLAANFAASTQIMGVRRTADFLEKATWILATALLVFSLVSTAVMQKPTQINESKIKTQVENGVDPSAVPNFPSGVPATENKPAQTQDAQKKPK